MSDVLKEQLEGKLKDYLKKGSTAILSGVGGAAAKAIFGLLIDGTTDPTTAMLDRIYDQLTNIKDQIKNLPRATSVYVNYDNALKDAKIQTDTISHMLSFTGERETDFGTFEKYLGSLKTAQLVNMAKFLTMDTEKTYYSFINAILMASYGVTILDLTDSSKLKGNNAGPAAIVAPVMPPMGESKYSFAQVVSEAELDPLPASLDKYVITQIAISKTVFTAIAAVYASAQLIYRTLQQVVATNTRTKPADLEVIEQVKATLDNREVKRNFDAGPSQPLPVIIEKILFPILNAPAYICGNAFYVYNAIIAKQPLRMYNTANRQNLVLIGPQGATLGNRMQGTCDYWSTGFSNANTGWDIAFKEGKESTITIQSRGIGYLYMWNPDIMVTNKIYVSPSTTHFGLLDMGKYSYEWKLQIMPQEKPKGSPGRFLFTLVNTKEEKALVNRKFVVGSDEIGAYPLDKFDGNHLWDLVPM